jgi:hypothetical protein
MSMVQRVLSIASLSHQILSILKPENIECKVIDPTSIRCESSLAEISLVLEDNGWEPGEIYDIEGGLYTKGIGQELTKGDKTIYLRHTSLKLVIISWDK